MGYKAMFNFGLLGCVLCLLLAFGGSSAFDISRPNNLVAHWGATLSENRLRAYCDGSVDAIVIDGDLAYRPDLLPAISMGTSACGDTMFPNSSLPQCQDLEADILECQNKGVAILMYIDTTGDSYWSLSSSGFATPYAGLLWDLFLGGTSSTRPFGRVPLDGVATNIFTTQAIHALSVLLDQLGVLSDEDGKRYFWAVDTLCAVALFDPSLGVFDSVFSKLSMIFVGVAAYACSVAHYDDKTQWNYGIWDNWISRQSPRTDFKLYFSVVASDAVSSTVTEDYAYANSSRLAQIASDTMAQYPKYFGGFLYDDAAYAASNDGFNSQLRQALSTLTLSSTSSSSSTSIASVAVTTQNPLPSDRSKSHLSHTKLIVSTTIPVLVIVCVIIATLVYLRRRRRRARRGDEDLGDSTGELIAPYPPPQDHTPDPWVPPVKWLERKSNSSSPGIPRDSPADTVQAVNAMQQQPQVLQNPEGLAALETEIGRVGLTVPALLASLGRLRTPPNAMSGDNVSETVTDPPEYS